MEQITLDNASASKITQALSDFGNGNMMQGIKKLQIENYKIGFSDGTIHGIKIVLIPALCILGTTISCQWIYNKIKTNRQKPTHSAQKINKIIEGEI